MKHILESVIPVGTPWGGPESRRYLSGFVSMLMQIEGLEGDRKELHAKHERLYHLYLAVTGIGVSSIWNERLFPCSHEVLVDRFFQDYVQRTMAYAGYQYSILERADLAAAKDRIVASIDLGRPVLSCSTASEWSLVTGYDQGGDTLIGWDGAHTYWGRPELEPDGYLESKMFATASWPGTLSRLVFVEGKTTPQNASADVLRQMVRVMEDQRPKGCDREFRALLYDDAFCQSADEDRFHSLWQYVNDYVGWYAENRCFSAFGLHILAEAEDVKANKELVDNLHYVAGHFFHTHDLCWEAWRALRSTHKCDPADDQPCHMCGGCLRPPTDEDFAALRTEAPRRRLSAWLQVIDWNDAKAMGTLRRCADLA
ncbi:MAG TPA: hypothetical protein VGN26_02745 [Armatimonadota bacterium]|jgi:hypothetical protein